jgi:hypothetical protein
MHSHFEAHRELPVDGTSDPEELTEAANAPSPGVAPGAGGGWDTIRAMA